MLCKSLSDCQVLGENYQCDGTVCRPLPERFANNSSSTNQTKDSTDSGTPRISDGEQADRNAALTDAETSVPDAFSIRSPDAATVDGDGALGLGQDAEIQPKDSASHNGLSGDAATEGDGQTCNKGILEADISEATINQLFGYRGLKGFLSVAKLNSLAGLECLETINGSFEVIEGQSLTNLQGLNRLTTITGTVYIENNTRLIDLDGLNNLEIIGGDLSIAANSALTTINGLNALKSVRGQVTIAENPVLTELNGLHALASVSRSLDIRGNSRLKKLNGIDHLSSVYGQMSLNGTMLSDIDELKSLTFVRGDFDIAGNTALVNINGLSSLERVETVLSIVNNGVLNNVDGLSRLAYVGQLLIFENASLENLDGLGNLNSVGSELSVFSNTRLPACEAENLARRLGMTCPAPDWYDPSITCTGRCTCTGNDGIGICIRTGLGRGQ